MIQHCWRHTGHNVLRAVWWDYCRRRNQCFDALNFTSWNCEYNLVQQSHTKMRWPGFPVARHVLPNKDAAFRMLSQRLIYCERYGFPLVLSVPRTWHPRLFRFVVLFSSSCKQDFRVLISRNKRKREDRSAVVAITSITSVGTQWVANLSFGFPSSYLVRVAVCFLRVESPSRWRVLPMLKMTSSVFLLWKGGQLALICHSVFDIAFPCVCATLNLGRQRRTLYRLWISRKSSKAFAPFEYTCLVHRVWCTFSWLSSSSCMFRGLWKTTYVDGFLCIFASFVSFCVRLF